jgi:DMSO/TMAO reductase YedYZ heme-binding membrane subunit
VATEHATKIYTVAIIGIVVTVAFLALTSIGHVVDAATQHFMLFYAGVFALIGLCASVVLGLIATDRMFMNPGRRVFIQSAHRAASFGAVAFLIIHIITEILAQRVHALDAVIPFLSPFRTFYIGLGTIASDLIILLVITGIMRGRFNASGKAWRWRAIHYASYLSFVFGVWHGLLAGRPGKPYVDWSYGFLVAVVLGGLAVRVLSNSLRPKENLSAPPVDQSASSASAPLRAAAMLAQYGATRGGRNVILGATTGSQPILSAPVSAPVLTALPAGGATTDVGQPYYEPGYEGPPRYLGAPRAETGPLPRAATGPMPRAATGSLPRAATGSLPRLTGSMPAVTSPLPPVSDPMARGNSGPMARPGSGQMPHAATGPMPRAATGSFPAAPARPQSWTGPNARPRPATGPLPQAGDSRPADRGTGPRSRPSPGPVPGGAVPRDATGPRPRPTGPMPTGSGPYPTQTGSGPYPTRSGSGPYPAPTGSGSYPTQTGSGPYPTRSGSGSYPMPTGSGSYPTRSGSGPYPAPTGSVPYPTQSGSGPYSTQSGPYPRPATGPRPQADHRMPPSAYPDGAGGRRLDRQGRPYPGRDGTDSQEWPNAGYDGTVSQGWPNAGYDGTVSQGWPNAGHDGSWYPEEPQWDDGFPGTDPNLRYREPGPGMPGYRGSREHRYGGDRYR